VISPSLARLNAHALTASAVWHESPEAFKLWVFMLCAADAEGYVRLISLDTLARRASLTLDDCERALAALEAPEYTRRTLGREWRHVVRVATGYHVVDISRYREVGSR